MRKWIEGQEKKETMWRIVLESEIPFQMKRQNIVRTQYWESIADLFV